MKKILIASGCSFTEKNFMSTFHPEMDCTWDKWPELLAQKLDMDCINLGSSGAGNEYIYNSIVQEFLKTKTNRIGLVMAGWTQAKRFGYRSRRPNLGDLHGRQNEDFMENISDYPARDWSLSTLHPKIKFARTYNRYSSLTNKEKMPILEHVAHRSIGFIFNLQTLCSNYNIPLKHFAMLDFFGHFSEEQTVPIPLLEEKIILNSPFLNFIDEKSFIGWPMIEKFGGYWVWDKVMTSEEHGKLVHADTISKQDLHPNQLGQQKIADFLYKKIKE